MRTQLRVSLAVGVAVLIGLGVGYAARGPGLSERVR